jgi:hypothetical protein
MIRSAVRRASSRAAPCMRMSVHGSMHRHTCEWTSRDILGENSMQRNFCPPDCGCLLAYNHFFMEL